MKTAWLAGGLVVAVELGMAYGSPAAAGQPVRQPTRQIDGGPGGGDRAATMQMNRPATRRVEGGPVGEPQVDQQTGQFRIQRQTVREGLRRMPMRPVGRWRMGVDTVNAPKGLLIADVSRNSPAYRFGLEPGDYLLDVMGYPVGFFQNGYYPLGDALNQLVRRDGWVNVLIWNRRTNGEEAMWIRLEPRGGQPIPFGARESTNN